jgi:Fic family protein
MRKIEVAPAYLDTLKKLSYEDFEKLLKPETTDLINKINENYYYWDKIKYLKTPEGVTNEKLWAFVKVRRRSSPFKYTIGKYSFYWFLSSRMQELLHLFDMNIGGSLESRSLIPKDDKNRYLISSIMEEAIASSQIEGAVTTRKQAKEMLRKNIPPKNRSEQMILNNYVTIQKILEIKDKDLTPELLLEVQQFVSKNTLESKEYEGSFRQSNDVNVVDVLDGEIVHSPPDHTEIEGLIKELCDFFNFDTSEPFIHPIIKGCIIHFLIGFIHPFVDGNGRTARALFYWYLLKKGYWLTEYMSISRLILRSKEQYARAFLYTENDENDLSYFIGYNLRTMKLAFDSLREYIQRKLEEKKQVNEFIKLEGVNERQAQILKWFYEEPSLIMTVRELETRMAIANQTARNDLNGLVKLGYLSTIEMNKKLQAFARSSIFD